MGIRYMAYAFDPHQTEQALERTVTVLCGYCAHEAWGARVLRRDEDTLDLDKAWSDLQRAAAPAEYEPARPAFRMFEGEPTWTDRGHLPWMRALAPAEVPAIAEDLVVLDDAAVARRVVQRHGERGPEYAAYTLDHLQSARSFVAALAHTGRGMVYTIG
ncbi:DUF1877 family protein [Janibacter hoylei]|uniref:DUF1877 family protein n=1 Tax=Janibacter hoylei TaxID=364298 RepID=UPI0027BA1AD1|nr:DUF1877 family protein [Janibacter hoylei]